MKVYFAGLMLCATAASTNAQTPGTIVEEQMVLELTPGNPDTVFERVYDAGGKHRTEILRTSGPPMPGMKAGMVNLMNSGDTSLAFIYVDSAHRAYAEMRPSAIFRQMNQLGGMKMSMDSSADSTTVDSLGDGPVIAGYKTIHFRTRKTSRMTMVLMGDSTTRSELTVQDLYVAPDLRDESAEGKKGDSTMRRAITGMMPGLAQIAARNASAMRRVNHAGRPLKTESEITSTTLLGKSVRHTSTEITSYRKVTIPDSLFVVPAGYRKVGIFDLLMPN